LIISGAEPALPLYTFMVCVCVCRIKFTSFQKHVFHPLTVIATEYCAKIRVAHDLVTQSPTAIMVL